MLAFEALTVNIARRSGEKAAEAKRDAKEAVGQAEVETKTLFPKK